MVPILGWRSDSLSLSISAVGVAHPNAALPKAELHRASVYAHLSADPRQRRAGLVQLDRLVDLSGRETAAGSDHAVPFQDGAPTVRRSMPNWLLKV